MKTKLIIFVLILFLFCGCDKFLTKKPESLPDMETAQEIQTITDSLNDNASKIQESTIEIREEAGSIKKNTGQAEKSVSSESREKITPHLKKIEESSNTIVEETAKIDFASGNIVSAADLLKESKAEIIVLNDQIKKLENTVDKVVSERDKAIEEKNSAIRNLLKWMIGLSILGIAICSIAFFLYGKKIQLLGAGASALVLAIAAFVSTYLNYIVIIGGVAALIFIVIMIYQIFIHKKAFKEVVETVEVTKENLPADKKIKLFGDADNNGVMDILQSNTTMEIVKQVKQDLSKLWVYTKKYNIIKDDDPS